MTDDMLPDLAHKLISLVQSFPHFTLSFHFFRLLVGTMNNYPTNKQLGKVNDDMEILAIAPTALL